MKLELDESPAMLALGELWGEHCASRDRLFFAKRFAEPPPDREPRVLADAFVGSEGHPQLKKAWKAMTRAEALDALAGLMSASLAYGSAARTLSKARKVAERLLKDVPEDAIYLTNASWQANDAGLLRPSGWMPLLGATFDAGVVVLTATHALLFWAGDED